MSPNKPSKKNEIILYRSSSGPELEVKVGADSVWLSQAQLAQLFATERSVITKHIKNVLASGELKEKGNVQKMHFASSAKPVKLYNLNIIISVGYRVNSKRATQFRIWATAILKKYLTAGYVLDERKIQTDDTKFNELKEIIKFIGKKADSRLLKDQSGELMRLLSAYAKSLTLLEKLDRNKLTARKKAKADWQIDHDKANSVIKAVKKDLQAKQEADIAFGREIDNRFELILEKLNSNAKSQSLEEQAANLLYRIIKDRPFADGNKRIGAFLFVYYLDRNNYLLRSGGEKKITDNTLTSLALLVAASDPREKEIMIKVITNLLQ